MLTLPWAAIFLATPAAWLRAGRWLALALLAVGYAAALADGLLGWPALAAMLLLLLAAWAVSERRGGPVRIAGHALFVALAVALSLHWWPGFHNPRAIGPVRFTPDAVPFTMYLNLDKPLTGFWLLLVLSWVRGPRGSEGLPRAGWQGGSPSWPRALLWPALLGLSVATAGCLMAAAWLGLVAWAPKLPSQTWLWLLNNLLLVTMAEEALFRGYVQGGLSRLLRRHRHGDTVAMLVAAVAFGLAHAAGGWQWMVLGAFAGIGYGIAWRLGGLPAAVLAHFGLNAVHFFLFTYPMAQPVGPL